MKFDTTKNYVCQNGQTIDYGIINGSNHIIFIKSGRGGTCQGYNDKYLKMAQRIHLKQGSTVICSSNPIDSEKSYDIDRSIIESYASEKGFDDYEVYLIGASNGAYQNIFLANKMPQARKMLCINMPLMINFHKATRELQTMDHIEKIFVYGTKDPSFSYVPFLEMKKYSMCRIIQVSGADHQFKERTDDFIALADLI